MVGVINRPEYEEMDTLKCLRTLWLARMVGSKMANAEDINAVSSCIQMRAIARQAAQIRVKGVASEKSDRFLRMQVGNETSERAGPCLQINGSAAGTVDPGVFLQL